MEEDSLLARRRVRADEDVSGGAFSLTGVSLEEGFKVDRPGDKPFHATGLSTLSKATKGPEIGDDDSFVGIEPVEPQPEDTSSIIRDYKEYMGQTTPSETQEEDELNSKFFGDTARTRFYGRFNWLGKQRYKINWKVDASTPGMVFNNESHPNINFPYSPRKKGPPAEEGGEVLEVSQPMSSFAISASRDSLLDDPDYDDDDLPDPRDDVYLPLSPRTKYIDNCMKQRLNPRASLMIRKRVSSELVLKNLGIGDKMAKTIADSLLDIPNVESINLADNRLTDEGMSPILAALVTLPTLYELNLSQNEVGSDTSQALAEYLGRDDCPLRKLTLIGADVDDGECEGFISALQGNSTLTEIDLSQNKLGSSEVLNTVMPDVTTGGEAIADWLRADTCALKTLILSWNMIRLDSAIDLCSALHKNVSLTYLDLSYNSLGHDGGLTLGDAIIDNRSLKTLIVANNNIDATACFTICVGAIENMSLTKLNLNGNPIGEQGARALMLVPMTVGDRIDITAYGSNISIRDSKCWFDSNFCCRSYKLDCSHPFERAVAFMLLRIVATHPTNVFKAISYIPLINKKPGKPENLDLVQTVSVDAEKFMTEDRHKMIEGLRVIAKAAGDHQLAKQMFEDADEDGGGELDPEEMLALFHSLGIMVDEERVDELIASVDLDGEGALDFNEFMVLLRRLGKEAKERLSDILEFPVMTIKGPAKKRYLPPMEGLLVCEVVDSFKLKPIFKSISQIDHDYAQKVARDSGAMDQMLGHAVTHAKLRLDEAYSIYKSMVSDSRNVVKCVIRLLPQVKDSSECKQLVYKICKNDRTSLIQIKNQLGLCQKPMFGHVNGFYSLDLTKEFDRMCLSQMMEKNRTSGGKRAARSKYGGYGGIGDTSQDGNWSCFRNELFNKQSIYITTERFIPLPKSGKLEFDFCTVDRPDYENTDPDDLLPIKDSKFVAVLSSFELITEEETEECEEKLLYWKNQLLKTLKCDGWNFYVHDKPKSIVIGETIDVFYNSLEERLEAFQNAETREEIKVFYGGAESQAWERRRAGIETPVPTAPPSREATPVISRVATEEDEGPQESAEEKLLRMMMASATEEDDEYPEIEPLPESKQPTNEELALKISESFHGSNADGEDVHYNSSLSVENKSGMSTPASGAGSARIRRTINTAKEFAASTTESSDEIKKDGDEEGEITITQGDNWDGDDSKKDEGEDPGEVIREQTPYTDPNDTRPQTTAATAAKNAAQHQLEEKTRFLFIWTSENVRQEAKAHKCVEMMDEILSRVWLECRQLALLLEKFEVGKVEKAKKFGTYRVEMVVSLFPRLLDLWNFEVISSVLTGYEIGCIYARIGILNVYNPMKPDGAWEFNLCNWDERQIAKTHAQLSVVEPGVNWLEQEFKWKRDVDPMPGWELTQGWMSDEGFPDKGVLQLTYFSGNGSGEKECAPAVKFRKSLLQGVLIDEEEMWPYFKEHVDSGVAKDAGFKHMMSNLVTWTNMLLPRKKAAIAV